MVLNSILGLLVAAADYEFAQVYPKMARDLPEIAGGNQSRIWTHGYWGWYYYAGQQSFPRYVIGSEEPPAGTLLLVPGEVAKPAVMPESVRARAHRVAIQATYGRLPIRLVSHQAGAGYYSAAWGPLPYAWSFLPCEELIYFEIGESAPPSDSPTTDQSDSSRD